MNPKKTPTKKRSTPRKPMATATVPRRVNPIADINGGEFDTNAFIGMDRPNCESPRQSPWSRFKAWWKNLIQEIS